MFRKTLTAAALIALASCAPSNPAFLTVEELDALTPTPPQRGDMTATIRRADLIWREREHESRLREAITLYARAITLTSPDLDPAARQLEIARVHVRLARAHHLLADSHLRLRGRRPELRQEMIATFEAGMEHAEIALSILDPKLTRELAAAPQKWAEHLPSAREDATAPLYWYAANLLGWGLARGPVALARHQDRARLVLEHVSFADEGYDHAGAARLLGLYHAEIPLSGGDSTASVAAFERSLELAPNFFATRLLYARHTAVLEQDRTLFEKQLRIILETPPNVVPELAPENTLARERARRLLDRQDELFF